MQLKKVQDPKKAIVLFIILLAIGGLVMYSK